MIREPSFRLENPATLDGPEGSRVIVTVVVYAARESSYVGVFARGETRVNVPCRSREAAIAAARRWAGGGYLTHSLAELAAEAARQSRPTTRPALPESDAAVREMVTGDDLPDDLAEFARDFEMRELGR